MENKKNISKFTISGLYLVILILVILAGQNLFFRLDLTSYGLYSLSQASKRAVSTLNEPLTINVFFSKNLPAPYNNIERYLHDLMDEYAAHSRRYLSYRFFNVSAKESELSEEAEENRQMAQDYGIYPVNVQTIEQDEAKVQRAYMGMAFIHGDIVERIPAVTSTEGLEYQITGTIQKMNNKISALLNLPEKIRVKLVQSSSLEHIAPQVGLEGLEGLRDLIAEVVDSQSTKTYGQLEFVYIDPSLQQLSEQELAPYRRFGLQWQEYTGQDGRVVPAGSGYLGLGMEFGEKSVETQLLSSSLNLTDQGLQEQFTIVDIARIESFIEENVDNLIDIHDEIGYLSTHGTQSLSPSLPPQLQMMQPQTGSLTQFNALLSDRYTINQIDMTEESIPESVDTLIIAGPKENFSDWELFQIDQFLMKGKSLALFVDSFNEIRPQQQQQMYGMQQSAYLPINTGLEKLLDHYGVSVRKSYILDESCYVSRDQQMGETPVYFAPIIKNENINHRLGFLSNIKELIMYRVSPVVLEEERLKENGLEARRMIASTSDAWEMAGQINLTPFMIRPPMNPEDKSQHALAYLLEGEFPSYFADKPVPEKPEPEEELPEEAEEGDTEGQQPPEKKAEEKPEVVDSQVKGRTGVIARGRPSRIFLIGSSEILTDNILGQQGQSPNSVFLLNTIDFLNNQEDIAVMRSKNQRFNPLKDTKAFTRTMVKVLNITGIPGLFLLFGFYVWVRRKAKRRAIQAMFSGGKA
jgi:ABC-type uncharacterized transport system involved in gliding motility auxiliary subunit